MLPHAWRSRWRGASVSCRTVVMPLGEAVGLAHVRGSLGEEIVWRDADRAADGAAGCDTGNLPLHLRRHLFGDASVTLSSHQFARHLVDRADACNRNGAVDRLDQRVVPPHIALGTCQTDLDAGTQPSCLAHQRAGAHAERLGFVAGGDQAGRVRVYRHHSDGTAAQRRILVLLHRGEIAVEVDEQAAQCHAMSRRSADSDSLRLSHVRRP
jgi:hypothetical protein